jgi:hypothetical protein
VDNEQIVTAIKKIGDPPCECPPISTKDIGLLFKCPEHGTGVINELSMSQHGSGEVAKHISVIFYA